MLAGIGVSKQIAIGVAFVLQNIKATTEALTDTAEPEQEIEKLRAALNKSKEQMQGIVQASDQQTASVVATQLDYLSDPSFNEVAIEKIRLEKCTAFSAIQYITQELYDTFRSFDDDPYVQGRAADIKDAGYRILKNLGGETDDAFSNLPANAVIIAQELYPSQTAKLVQTDVVGFVTEDGGKTSHTAIMARNMGIAAIVGCAGIMSQVNHSDTIIIDGVNGRVFINPDEAILLEYRQKIAEEKTSEDLLRANQSVQLRKQNGQRIYVAANIGSLAEAQIAKKNGADGIGLFRTECFYMGRSEEPCEEEQFEVYRTLSELFFPAPVIIRTFDIGGDKPLPYLPMSPEKNPFLGVRAIRLSMKYKEMFGDQLRALLRANVLGNLKLMFPMIGNLQELRDAKAVLQDCMEQLEQKGVPFKRDTEVGMMIEVPAAAIIADLFAKEVDFFSIGTNDLTQYSLAVDRGNTDLCGLYDCMHPGVLRLIQTTITAAHQCGILCGMCGEMAGEKTAIPFLNEYGLDEYSVSPSDIGRVKTELMKRSDIQIM